MPGERGVGSMAVRERAKYLLDGRTFRRNAIRDLSAFAIALAFGVTLFELTVIYLLDALVRSTEAALRVRQARGQARGVVEPFMEVNNKPVNPTDPAALSWAVLFGSVTTVGLAGPLLLLAVHGTYGPGDVHLVRAAVFSLAYTVPFAVYEHMRWMRDKADDAVPHVLARDLSLLLPFLAAVIAFWIAPLVGVVAFVVLRALHDSVDMVPEYSPDGQNWTRQWREEWSPAGGGDELDSS